MITPDEIRLAITAGENGTILSIEVSAGSKVESFPSGFNVWRKAVGIQVKAPAVDGKANKAILTLISKRCNISGSGIQIISGHTSSLKRVFLSGVDPENLVTLLVSYLNAP